MPWRPRIMRMVMIAGMMPRARVIFARPMTRIEPRVIVPIWVLKDERVDSMKARGCEIG